jgi:hypothetical protein
MQLSFQRLRWRRKSPASPRDPSGSRNAAFIGIHRRAAEVPRDRQAPLLARPAAAVDARHVLLIAVAADRHHHVQRRRSDPRRRPAPPSRAGPPALRVIVARNPMCSIDSPANGASTAALRPAASSSGGTLAASSRAAPGDTPRTPATPATPPARRSTSPHASASAAVRTSPAIATSHSRHRTARRSEQPQPRTARSGRAQPHGHVAVVQREHRGLPAGRERHRHAPASARPWNIVPFWLCRSAAQILPRCRYTPRAGG